MMRRIATLPRLGSRVRIPSPAPLKHKQFQYLSALGEDLGDSLSTEQNAKALPKDVGLREKPGKFVHGAFSRISQETFRFTSNDVTARNMFMDTKFILRPTKKGLCRGSRSRPPMSTTDRCSPNGVSNDPEVRLTRDGRKVMAASVGHLFPAHERQSDQHRGARFLSSAPIDSQALGVKSFCGWKRRASGAGSLFRGGQVGVLWRRPSNACQRGLSAYLTAGFVGI
jgi:hypothetical protein